MYTIDSLHGLALSYGMSILVLGVGGACKNVSLCGDQYGVQKRRLSVIQLVRYTHNTTEYLVVLLYADQMSLSASGTPCQRRELSKYSYLKRHIKQHIITCDSRTIPILVSRSVSIPHYYVTNTARPPIISKTPPSTRICQL